ncbi:MULTISPECIES: DUF1365 domain-containing protein [unclassified Acinetobacter]|uniref:DUF1365 domain-containing protein n=1 Tax=unclassified Acinetobacter TaxID=196816 RepID=UPI0029346638|nr:MULTISPECIES: DUF1365 domain-containing protein [unclassified Acinetobacter]WOE32433.1 DUF1365 domain-containing protein [Acinetobacter sp. SAAs470]WOE37907.1 DUF1365 domain-containing protein [Acinetobacter sp. SAAs474]
MAIYPLAIASAHIRHRRYLPQSHRFNTTLSYLWFDPDQLATFTQQCVLWSNRGWNVIGLDPQDFLIMHRGTIREKVADLLLQQQHYHLSATETIRVLALPRSCGFRFNSVVFYVIFDLDQQPVFILSEITNTPWKERKVYIHDCRKIGIQYGPYKTYQFDFKKDFHISPFMPMALDYRWRFSFSEQYYVIHMQLFEQDVLQFDATMKFSLQAITFPSQQYRYAVCKVIEPFRMVAGIYMNALRLWKKKVPFYRHPQKDKGNKG